MNPVYPPRGGAQSLRFSGARRLDDAAAATKLAW
jgi:hypothetical protein